MGQEARIMAGHAEQAQGGQAKALGQRRHVILHCVIEAAGQGGGEFFGAGGAGLGGGGDGGGDGIAQAEQRCRIGVAQIDGKLHLLGHHRGRVGRDGKAADGEAGDIGGVGRQRIQSGGGAGGGEQGVAPCGAGGGAGMRRLALNGDGEGALALQAGHDAQRDAGLFQHHALLDMRLQIGMHGAAERADGQVRQGGEGGLQRLLHGDAIGIAAGEDFGDIARAGKTGRAHHARCEAAALLIGPGHHLDGAAGGRWHRFQRCQHAIGAVVFAAGGLAVDMAADQQWRQVFPALAAQEEIAQRVGPGRHAGLGGPGDDGVFGLGLGGRERRAVHPAIRPGAMLRQALQPLPEAGAIDHQETFITSAGLARGSRLSQRPASTMAMNSARCRLNRAGSSRFSVWPVFGKTQSPQAGITRLR